MKQPIKRRKLTVLDKLKIIVAQATCPLCGEKLGQLEGLQFDHRHALSLGGSDENENIRAVHAQCHAIKTHGKPATSAGSDVGEMRKTRQLVTARVERGEVAPDDPSIARWAPDPSRRQPQQKPIQGRGFASRPADKPSPCRVPSKLAGLPRNTFTEPRR